MSMIQFVRNYDDLSTDRGYQFKFHCDKCGNGFMTSFQPSVIGTAGSVLRAAGSIFGGFVGSVGNSAYEIQRAVGGPAHDHALATAVQEGKQHFLQCQRCGKWVCPEVCWNPPANQCDECAPKLEQELVSSQAHAKAQAASNQLNERAQKVDYTSGIDMSAGSVLRAPGPLATGASTHFCGACGAHVEGKFCQECGAPVQAAPPRACSFCGCKPEHASKFCPECGKPMAA